MQPWIWFEYPVMLLWHILRPYFNTLQFQCRPPIAAFFQHEPVHGMGIAAKVICNSEAYAPACFAFSVSAITLFRHLAPRSLSRSGQISIISAFICSLYMGPPEDELRPRLIQIRPVLPCSLTSHGCCLECLFILGTALDVLQKGLDSTYRNPELWKVKNGNYQGVF